MIRKNLMKSLSVIMAAMLAVMTVACGKAGTEAGAAIETAAQVQETDVVEQTIATATQIAGTESEAGKVETVYVTADANGAVNDVIVSEWLKNVTASSELADTTELKDIVNVKGSETFTDNGDGSLTWNADGSDIYYQGTTDKQLPVTMKITYTLDGKEIAPEELAGKSGKVTIHFEYENNAKQTVNVKGNDIEVYTPFAVVSGMLLDSDKFANVEISNGKVISDGGKYVIMGVATPGLKESLDISDENWDKLEDADEIKEKLSNSFEITADTTDFELGMTITMASSDLLSDFGLSDLTDSDEIEKIKDDMGELRDGSGKLVDGTKTLKDGTTELRDGTGKLYNGTTDLADGAKKLYSGATELSDGTAKLLDGTGSLSDGAAKLYDGTGSLKDGTVSLKDGTEKLYKGVKDYTDGAAQINAGAGQLAGGIAKAKAGSDQLLGGMQQKDLKTNANKLVQGGTQISSELSKFGTAVDAITTLKGMYDSLSAAEAYLTGDGELSAAAVSGLAIATNGKVSSAETAAALKGAKSQVEDGANTLQGGASQFSEKLGELSSGLSQLNASLNGGANAAPTASTETVTQTENYEENVVDAEFGEVKKDEAQPVEEQPVVEEKTEEEKAVEEKTEEEKAVEEKAVEEEPVESVDTLTTSFVMVTAPVGSGEVTPEMLLESKAATNNSEESITLTGDDLDKYQQFLDNYDAYMNYLNNKAKYDNYDALQYKCQVMEGQLDTIKGSIGQLSAGASALSTSSQSLAEGATKLQGGIPYYGSYNQALGSVQGMKGVIKTILAKVSIDPDNYDPATVETLKQKFALIQQFTDGSVQLAAGVDSIYDATAAINSGLGELQTGANTLAAGTQKLTSNNDSLVSGASQLNDGAAKLDDGAGQLKDGAGQLKDGAGQLQDGAGQLNSGAHELSDGAGKLSNGANDLNSGAKELNDGVITLDDGVKELLDGVCKLDKEGIQKLYEAFDGDLTEFADRMTAIQEAANEYKSFGGSNDDVNSSCKFIIKTDSIKDL